MTALQDIVVGGVNQTEFDQTLSFSLIVIEGLEKHFLVALFKGVLGVLVFRFLKDITVEDPVSPFKVVNRINVLDVFSQPFQTIGNF